MQLHVVIFNNQVSSELKSEPSIHSSCLHESLQGSNDFFAIRESLLVHLHSISSVHDCCWTHYCGKGILSNLQHFQYFAE